MLADDTANVAGAPSAVDHRPVATGDCRPYGGAPPAAMLDGAMRILVMANNFPWPGNADGIFNLRQAQALRELGHQVRVLRWVPWQPPTRKKSAKYRTIPKRYDIEGVPVHAMRAVVGPASRGIGTFPYQLRSRITREIAAFAPDLVHVHGVLPAGMMGLCSSVPFVLTAHGSDTYRLPYLRPALRALASRVVSKAAACAAVSEFCAKHLRAFGAPAPAVIFNGADERTFRPRDRERARAELGLDRERPVVLYAGHLMREKGTRELAEAIVELRDLGAQFLIAGTGAEEAAIRAVAGEHDVAVRLCGWVEQTQLATLLAACDVFVLPSHYEGLPSVICEAMNAARAVVATPVGGIPEIVADGRTGYLVPVGDARALAARIRTVVRSPELRDDFEREALAFAGERLTWRANARAYEALYQRIAQRPGHAETRTLTGCPTGT